jgi:hypothetical protein
VGVGDDGKGNQAKTQRDVDRAFHFGLRVLHFRVGCIQCMSVQRKGERGEGSVGGGGVCLHVGSIG